MTSQGDRGGFTASAIVHIRHGLAILSLPLLVSLGPRTELAAEGRRPDILIYHGIYSETDILPIAFQGKTDYRNSWITVLGWSQPLNTQIRPFEFEAEGQLGLHSGLMKHAEVNGLMVGRIRGILGLPFNLAMGEGLSIASTNPPLENKKKGMRIDNERLNEYQTVFFIQHYDPSLPPLPLQTHAQQSRPVLNYLMVEAEIRFNDVPWSPGIFMRLHHRSGVFGLYCPPHPACESNFVSYGVKWPVP